MEFDGMINDFRINCVDAETILLEPLTPRGREWLQDHVVPDQTWIAGLSLRISIGYAETLFSEILDAGLTIEKMICTVQK
jgi:hypothetical protein